jgi:hypothetical protein
MQTPVTSAEKGGKSERLCGTAFLALRQFGLLCLGTVSAQITVQLILRPTVSQPVCQGVRHQSGAHDPIFCYYEKVAGLSMWGIFSHEKTDLQFSNAAGHCQHSHSQIRIPRDSSYFPVSDSTFSNLEDQVPLFISPWNSYSPRH